jgi:hypothetical protein
MYQSRDGFGNQSPSTAYPNQGLDLKTQLYSWLKLVGGHRLEHKFAGRYTPYGTPVAALVRLDRTGMFASKCGGCGEAYKPAGGLCGCDRAPKVEA